MDTGQSSSTRTPACLQHSTVPSEETVSCSFPLASSAPNTSSRRRWIRSLKSAKDVLESQMTSLSTTTLRQNMMPTCKTSCRLPTNTSCCLIHKKHMSRLKPSISLAASMMLMVSTQTRERLKWYMPCQQPTNITELQEFLGLVMYLSPFIPGLSTLTAALHELLQKDTDFIWNHTYNATFQQVKEAVISDTTLRYFDPSLPMTIQVDVSQVGLGAALLQNGKPHSFHQQGPY